MKNKKSSGGRKRVYPNVPRAGIVPTKDGKSVRYCGGGRKKACGGKKH
jgi:hypothetical protein